jgi:aminoglycoside phosphotransferase family enzyme/predicted kinase
LRYNLRADDLQWVFMEPSALIDALSNPAAYPEPVTRVDVRQTHISIVFLTERHAYKVKKPVAYGFLDFSSLDKRKHFCEEEVRLNRRLAPDVYLGVVSVTRAGTRLRFAGPGELVDWAVKMRRLPEEAAFHERLRRGDIDETLVELFARRLADFHQAVAESPVPSGCGRFETVARNIREIFAQSQAQVGALVSRTVYERLQTLTEESLARLRPLIEGRAARGVPRDTHGDLHLDHVYYFPDRPPPGDLVIVDCIEFNERFRFIDPVADMAFPYMDFQLHGRRDLAETFVAAYFRATGDEEGRVLLPFYSSYRAAVRGSVGGLKLEEKEVLAAERGEERQQARAHWLLALGLLEQPANKPALVLVGGLPGTGKSTLAKSLAERANLEWVRSDVVRKELAGLAGAAPSPPAMRLQLYSPEASERTYAECLRRAEALLFEGKRVVVDATFRDEIRRRTFLEAAARWAVPALLLVATADAEVVKQRLLQRTADASDADWQIYLQMAWEPPDSKTQAALREIDTSGARERALEVAFAELRKREIV